MYFHTISTPINYMLIHDSNFISLTASKVLNKVFVSNVLTGLTYLYIYMIIANKTSLEVAAVNILNAGVK